jgi:hypothetical protein
MDFSNRAAAVASGEVMEMLVDMLDEAIEERRKAEYDAGRGSGQGDVALNRIGAGYIGLECGRELAFRYHRAIKERIDTTVNAGELARHAEAGHWTEHMTAAWMGLCGITVKTAAPDEIGKQIGWKAARDANGQYHMAGEVDGIITEVEHPHLKKLLEPPLIWESKKATDKKWKKFCKETVRKADPVYYGQMQTNMGYLGVTKTLFSMLNLDTMKYYFELILFDLETAQRLSDRAVQVISSKSPYDLARLGRGLDDVVCKFCDYRRACWDRAPPPFNPNDMDEVPF